MLLNSPLQLPLLLEGLLACTPWRAIRLAWWHPLILGGGPPRSADSLLEVATPPIAFSRCRLKKEGITTISGELMGKSLSIPTFCGHVKPANRVVYHTRSGTTCAHTKHRPPLADTFRLLRLGLVFSSLNDMHLFSGSRPRTCSHAFVASRCLLRVRCRSSLGWSQRS